MKGERYIPLLLRILFCLCVSLFLLSVILWHSVLAQLHHWFLRPALLLRLSIIFLLLNAARDLYQNRRVTLFLQAVPFLILFLTIFNRYSNVEVYKFGADDAYYYSYVSSWVIDRDLELSNQFQLGGLHDIAGKRILGRRTEKGYSVNNFPIGLSLFWLPFFLVGHLLGHILNGLGITTAMNGYTAPYLNSVVAGNLFYGVGGLFVVYLFVSRFFSRMIALISTLGIYFTTPLYVYFNGFYLVSEPISVLLVGGLLLLTVASVSSPGRIKILLIGVLGGLATAVRLHNIVFLIVPVVFLVFRKKDITCGFWLAGGALLGFLPQLIVWKIMTGEWIPNLAGRFLPWWKEPFVLETLFSSRKGLFPWSPVIVFSLSGLILLMKTQRKWRWLLLSLFVINVYLNASQWDWWGSTAFGARRFLNCSVIFCLGFAAFYAFLHQKLRITGHVIAISILLFLASMNLFLAQAFWHREIEYDHAQKFSEIFHGSTAIYNYVVYPLELPAQIYYHYRYGVKLYEPRNEWFIGDDVFYFMQKVKDPLSGQSPLFGRGWATMHSDGEPVLATNAGAAIINIPLFVKQMMSVSVEMEIQSAEMKNNLWAKFYLNDLYFQQMKVPAKPGTISFGIPRNLCLSKVNELKIEIHSDAPDQKETPVVLLRSLNFRN